MGAKTEIKKLPALFDRRAKAIKAIAALESVINKLTKDFEKQSLILIDKYAKGEIGGDFFYAVITKIAKTSNGRLAKLGEGLTAKKKIESATSNEIRQIIDWCVARIADKSSNKVKSRRIKYITAIDKRSKALRGKNPGVTNADVAADKEVKKLQLKLDMWINFTRTIMPKYAKLSDQLKVYSKLLIN